MPSAQVTSPPPPPPPGQTRPSAATGNFGGWPGHPQFASASSNALAIRGTASDSPGDADEAETEKTLDQRLTELEKVYGILKAIDPLRHQVDMLGRKVADLESRLAKLESEEC